MDAQKILSADWEVIHKTTFWKVYSGQLAKRISGQIQYLVSANADAVPKTQGEIAGLQWVAAMPQRILDKAKSGTTVE